MFPKFCAHFSNIDFEVTMPNLIAFHYRKNRGHKFQCIFCHIYSSKRGNSNCLKGFVCRQLVKKLQKFY